MTILLRTIGAALVVVAAILTPSAVGATPLVESFTLPISPTVFVAGGATFPSSSVALFNSALGTLNDIKIALTGSVTFSMLSSSDFVKFDEIEAPGSPFNASFSSYGQAFPAGTSAVNLSGTDTATGDFPSFTGPGSSPLAFHVFASPGDTISATTLSGTLTFDYTPTAVPEPASFALLGSVLVGLGAVRRRRERSML